MAKNIVVQVLGGTKQVKDDLNTVKDVKNALGFPNHTATLNGDAAEDGQELSDGDFVFLSQAVKGGNI